MNNFSIFPLGDNAVILEFGKGISRNENRLVHEAAEKITREPFNGYIEAVPAFNTLTIHYDVMKAGTYADVSKKIIDIFSKPSKADMFISNFHRIPVCYDEEFAPDLSYMAEKLNVTKEEIISLHSTQVYYVYFLGFSAGFPFLGGLSSKLAISRKESPRLKVPAGSVGIAGSQTGIYPMESPGGWQIIGRTPIRLFCPEVNPPVQIKPGDQVTFVPISIAEYYQREDL